MSIKAQTLPKKPTLQQLAAYQNKQQLNWQQKQLPASSVTYRFSTNYQTSTKEFGKQQPIVPVAVNYSQPLRLQQGQQKRSAPSLQSYLQEERRQYMLREKQSWWKDPAKLKGAELLRDFYITNRRS